MTTPKHEAWQDEFQREPRTIVDAFRAERDTDDQDRKDEQYLDDVRGLWGPTE
jgi:hypothetical protein